MIHSNTFIMHNLLTTPYETAHDQNIHGSSTSYSPNARDTQRKKLPARSAWLRAVTSLPYLFPLEGTEFLGSPPRAGVPHLPLPMTEDEPNGPWPAKPWPLKE